MSAHEPSNDGKLAAFRQQIDALDDRIIALLIERIGIVARVGEMKRAAATGRCPIRAGREADMVRRIMKKFEGSGFDPAAAAALWRILIGSSTCVESPLSLSVYVPERDETLTWLAREYFGPTLPVTRQPHTKRVIGDVMDGKVSVGILPNLRGGGDDDWWSSLMPADAPKIFAQIPFVRDGAPTAPTALAIGYISPEATGDDRSLLVFDTDGNTSQHRLQNAFVKASLQAQWIGITTPSASIRRHLVEIHGFMMLDSAELTALSSEMGTSLQNIAFLGAYAAPVLNTLSPHTPLTHAAAPPAKA